MTWRQANCLLLEADWSCAPFSTPLVWNFALQDSGSEASNLSTTQEADEFRPPRGESISQAYVFYVDAEKKYQQAGASRGLAEVQLRYGYLAMLARNYSRGREQQNYLKMSATPAGPAWQSCTSS